MLTSVSASSAHSAIDPIHDLYEAIIALDEMRVRELLAIEPRPAWEALTKLGDEPKNLLEHAVSVPVILQMILDCYNDQINVAHKNQAFDAVFPDYLASARILLEFCNPDFDVDSKDTIFRAVIEDPEISEANRLAFIEVLVQHCINDLKPHDRSYIVEEAATNGFTEILELLVPHHPISDFDYEIGTAFWIAAERGFDGIIEILLDSYSAQISADNKGHALYLAAHEDKLDTVSYLLERCSADISTNDILGAIFIATFRDHQATAQILLEHHPITTRTPRDRLDAIAAAYKLEENDLEETLIWGASMGRLDIVHILIASGRFPNISDNAKVEALLEADGHDETDIVNFFLLHCSNDITSEYKFRVLLQAVTFSNLTDLQRYLTDPSFLEVAHFNNNELLKRVQRMTYGNIENRQAVINRLMQIPAVAELANQPPEVVIAPLAPVIVSAFAIPRTTSSSSASSAFFPNSDSHKRFRRQ